MGTNYYCKIKGEEKHIGKSSGGWVFALHVYPDEGILNLSDWLPDLSVEPIEDEYGTPISYDEMVKIITERKWNKPFDGRDWKLGSYKNESDFHQKNYSLRGPNNLLRHRIGSYCIGHGKGTWDCMVGDFS
jgi:hypothetical protein